MIEIIMSTMFWPTFVILAALISVVGVCVYRIFNHHGDDPYEKYMPSKTARSQMRADENFGR